MSDALDTSFSHVVLDLGLFSSDEFVAGMEDLVYFMPLVEGLVVHPHLFDVELVQGKLALILAQHDLVLSLHMHAFLLLEQLLRPFDHGRHDHQTLGLRCLRQPIVGKAGRENLQFPLLPFSKVPHRLVWQHLRDVGR